MSEGGIGLDQSLRWVGILMLVIGGIADLMGRIEPVEHPMYETLMIIAVVMVTLSFGVSHYIGDENVE